MKEEVINGKFDQTSIMSMIPFLDIIDDRYIQLVLSAIETIKLDSTKIRQELFFILERGFFYFSMTNGIEFDRNGVKYLICHSNCEVTSLTITIKEKSVSI